MVEEAYVEDVLAGRIRVGTLQSYAQLENGRRDPGDGAVTYFHSRPLTYQRPDDQELMEQLGLAGTGFAADNVFIRTPPPLYVFCMMEPGCHYDPDDRAPKPAKAILRVKDMENLARRLVELYPQRFAGGGRVDRVTYKPRLIDACRDGVNEDPDPFVKDIRFRSEQEIRLVLEPPRGHKPEPFVTGPDGPLGAIFELVKSGI